MDLVERDNPFAKRHPWEVARAEFFLRLVVQHGLTETGGDWLDVGSGDAWFATQLRRVLSPESSLTCWDINYEPEDIASFDESEGVTLVADRPGKQFDGMLMLDVIEHVVDDAGFVASIVRDLLAPSGFAVVSVPAHPALFSSHDVELRHYRRYSPAACRRLLERSGLNVIRDGGLFHALLPVRAGQVLIERVRPVRSLSGGIGQWQAGKVTTKAVTSALVADGRLAMWLSERGRSLPGLSYWALCRAKSS